jgi:hypothetical protein
MSRELMQQALEALRTLHDENMDYLTRNNLGGENNQCMVFARETITALRERLAQPVQEPVQEPVAYWNTDESSLSFKPGRSGVWVPLYSDPKPCPTCESLAMAVMNDQTYHEKVIPKREWVELTKEEMFELFKKYRDKPFSLVLATHDKLKEKNQ